MPDTEPLPTVSETSKAPDPSTEKFVPKEQPKKEKSWTEKGKEWLGGLKEKLSRNGQNETKEVLEEISEAPSHEKELLTIEESVEQVQTQETTTQQDKSLSEEASSVESPTVSVATQESVPTETQPNPEEPGEVGRDEGSAPETEVQQESKEVARPVSFPRTELLSYELTEEVIAQSVDEYISWRKEHEDKEGVVEPGRAQVIAHSTSSDSALDILKEGKLMSTYNMVSKDGDVRIDRMQGGKSKYIVGHTQMLLNDNPEIRKHVMDNRQKIFDNVDWLPDHVKEVVSQEIDQAQELDEVVSQLRGSVIYGWEHDEFGMLSQYGALQKNSPWLYIANVLPQEERAKIAEKAGSEKYISATLGHAMPGYTPDRKDPSTQAAILLDADKHKSEGTVYAHGGRPDFTVMADRWWETAKKELQEEESSIFAHEYGGGAMETNILTDENNGTVINLDDEGVVLLPKSKQSEVEGLSGGVVWFDDEKFRNVDEALGWLVTTPEGRKIYEEKKNAKKGKRERVENERKDGGI